MLVLRNPMSFTVSPSVGKASGRGLARGILLFHVVLTWSTWCHSAGDWACLVGIREYLPATLVGVSGRLVLARSLSFQCSLETSLYGLSIRIVELLGVQGLHSKSFKDLVYLLK